MTQTVLNRAVVRAIGETVDTFRRIGFLLSEPGASVDDPEDEGFGPHVIDWDAFHATSTNTVSAAH